MNDISKSDFYMNIVILSREKSERLSYTDFSLDKIIISICDPGGEKANLNSGNGTIKDTFYLELYDISTQTQDVFKGYVSMSDEDAIEIRDFVLEWKDKVNTLCVQCEMGISRSAGVAAGILKAFEKDASVILNDTRYYPNLSCYEKTVNAF